MSINTYSFPSAAKVTSAIFEFSNSVCKFKENMWFVEFIQFCYASVIMNNFEHSWTFPPVIIVFYVCFVYIIFTPIYSCMYWIFCLNILQKPLLLANTERLFWQSECGSLEHWQFQKELSVMYRNASNLHLFLWMLVIKSKLPVYSLCHLKPWPKGYKGRLVEGKQGVDIN